ncbi:MAG: lipopolysaccharide transport periplasmic protein LptA [Betaproteobacteria bacterium]|nr:lipopolysaccharide transport periplasmic protein LptA [Betaproteobacteria bacterium]
MSSRIVAIVAVSLFCHAAVAERADRDKPIQLEAASMQLDDAKKVHVLEGDVVVVKGTMVLRADKVVITEDQYGFHKGIATGGKDGLARIRQKREGVEEYVDGEAERIDYDTRSEVAEFFRRAWVRSGQDQVRGDYIWYDGIAEKYLVTAGKPGDAKAPPARVRAILQPRNKGDSATPAASGGVGLKGADSLGAVPPVR